MQSAKCSGNVCCRGASSTGRCNTGVKSLCWRLELQGLPWPFVELTRHFVQMSLRVHREVGSLRKVLSQQTIGVLIGTALPRTLRIAEVDVDVGRQGKSSMVGKFFAAVPGQGFIQRECQITVCDRSMEVDGQRIVVGKRSGKKMVNCA
jgi:hypothetical protein